MISIIQKSCFSLFLGVLILTMTGYVSADEYRGTTGNIIGSWRFKDRNSGPQTITFRKDGVYEVDDDGDGQKDIWGSYRLSRDWLFLNDLGGDFISDCGQDGAYTYRVKRDVMTFVLMADQCPSRNEAMNFEWERIPKFYPPEIKIKI